MSLRRSAFAAVALILAAFCAARSEPAHIIVDTDMQTDCDDVAALAVLHALADSGEAEIVGTMVSVLNPWAAPCVDAINTYYRRPDLPLGVLKGSDGVNLPSKFAQGIAESFPHDTKAVADLPDSRTLYRQLLAKAPDGSLTILSLGYMTNLANLLNSPPDEASPLSGRELIQRKVKTWVCMGGNFPDDHLKTGPSDNVNFRRHPASVIDCVSHWSGPIVFVGREIGHSMRAGAQLSQAPASHPVRRAYELYYGGNTKAHHCADIAAVLYAVRGLGSFWDRRSNGSVKFTDSNALFQWVDSPDADQAFLVQKAPAAEVAKVLEELMRRAPR